MLPVGSSLRTRLIASKLDVDEVEDDDDEDDDDDELLLPDELGVEGTWMSRLPVDVFDFIAASW
jgi:hypothetical protein